MNDMELYKEYIKDRKRAYGARRVKKEKKVRKKHFLSHKQKIQGLAIEAKEMGLTKWQAERHIEKGIYDNNQVIHIYGSFVFFIIQALIQWLIKRILNNYFDDKD